MASASPISRAGVGPELENCRSAILRGLRLEDWIAGLQFRALAAGPPIGQDWEDGEAVYRRGY